MDTLEYKMVLNAAQKDDIDDILYCDVDTISDTYGFTQKLWAKVLGVSESTISSWIDGKSIPTIAEKAIKYELLKNTLFQYKKNNTKSMIVEQNEKYYIYKVPEFNFENGEGKLIAETFDPRIARLINIRHIILKLVRDYQKHLEDMNDSDVYDDTISYINELFYFISTGETYVEMFDKIDKECEEKIENRLTEKQQKSPIYRTKKWNEYSKLQVIPDGTKLRMIKTQGKSKGEYFAEKKDGYIFGKNNEQYDSLSGAAKGEIGFGSWNGWTDWECLVPGATKWEKATEVRKRFKKAVEGSVDNEENF